MFLPILLAVLCGLAQSQPVRFENSYTLQRDDGFICSILLEYGKFFFSSCSNAMTDGGSDPTYELQVWDCRSTVCTPYIVVETGLNSGNPIRLMASELYGGGVLRFVIADQYEIRFFTCDILVDVPPNELSIWMNFDPIPISSFEFVNLIIGASATDNNGDSRLVGSDDTKTLVNIDCLASTGQCVVIDNIPVTALAPEMNLTTVFRTATQGGSVLYFSDIRYSNERGCIVKMTCKPIGYTLGSRSAECAIDSFSVAVGSKPFSHVGYELIAHRLPASVDLLILAGAPGWTDANGYNSGAVFTFLCPKYFDLGSPCNSAERDVYYGPSSLCFENSCRYGDIGTISVVGPAKHFAIGTPRANGGVGGVDVFYCREFYMMGCSKVGSFSPNQPPRSDFYGSVVIFENSATKLAVTAGYHDLHRGGHHLWMVDTIFNVTETVY